MSKFSRQLREIIDKKDIKFDILFDEMKNYMEADELKRFYASTERL